MPRHFFGLPIPFMRCHLRSGRTSTSLSKSYQPYVAPSVGLSLPEMAHKQCISDIQLNASTILNPIPQVNRDDKLQWNKKGELSHRDFLLVSTVKPLNQTVL